MGREGGREKGKCFSQTLTDDNLSEALDLSDVTSNLKKEMLIKIKSNQIKNIIKKIINKHRCQCRR